MQTTDAAAFLESNLPLVESVIREVARRQRAGGEEIAEFRSLAFIKLVEHDYAVLRRFQGHSSLRTYLAVVLQRVLLDHRNREWGRWRASTAAQRIGPVAVQLDRLITRDGLTAEEALGLVGATHDVSGCMPFVEALKQRGSSRRGRCMLGEDAIPECADPGPGPDVRADEAGLRAYVTALRRRVEEALRQLDSQDHLIVTLHFRDGLSVADVARVMRLEAKPLYRRITRILAGLQAKLSEDPACRTIAAELAGVPWSDFMRSGESGWWRSSNRASGTAPDRGDMAGEDVPRRGAARRLHRRVRRHPVPDSPAASV